MWPQSWSSLSDIMSYIHLFIVCFLPYQNVSFMRTRTLFISLLVIFAGGPKEVANT